MYLGETVNCETPFSHTKETFPETSDENWSEKKAGSANITAVIIIIIKNVLVNLKLSSLSNN